MKIRIGTRRSKLAMWQARFVENKLQEHGLETEIVTIDTKGDKIQHVTIAKIGSKGVFTEEIEEQLMAGSIDIAVHSAKDMQSILPDSFEIIAFTEREVVNDVLVSHDSTLCLDQDAKFTIGTSSTRRVALLRHYFPGIKTVDIRGNLQTRMQKLNDGHCDALILAFAGVHRMNFDDKIIQRLPMDTFTTPVGQGSIAIEVAKSLNPDKKSELNAILDHRLTSVCLRSERAYLRKLNGGCSIPSFANAVLEDEKITISGGIVSLDGQKIVRHTVAGTALDAEVLGEELGKYVLSHGGKEILEEIRTAI